MTDLARHIERFGVWRAHIKLVPDPVAQSLGSTVRRHSLLVNDSLPNVFPDLGLLGRGCYLVQRRLLPSTFG